MLTSSKPWTTWLVGIIDGRVVGTSVGLYVSPTWVGLVDGAGVGVRLGILLGMIVGTFVGAGVLPHLLLLPGLPCFTLSYDDDYHITLHTHIRPVQQEVDIVEFTSIAISRYLQTSTCFTYLDRWSFHGTGNRVL